MNYLKIIPVGDESLSIEFPSVIDVQINREIQWVCKKIINTKIMGIRSLIPAYHTLMVTFDPIQITYSALKNKIEPILQQGYSSSDNVERTLKIPVCYEAPFNPDLQAVADFAGLTTDEVVQLHTKNKYLIYFLGFLPGFAYMASVDKEIAMPRLETPRVKIPAGSVGIAGIQTGFYPVDAPGGWRLIGRTPLTLYDKNHPELFFHSGDFVQFVSITSDEYEQIKLADQKGEYHVEVVLSNG